MSTCQVTILLFASAKEAVKRSRIQLTVSKSTCIEELINQILPKEYPTLTQFLQFSQIALNCEYIDKDSHHLLQQGDEIAIIVPVSGG
ncbi:Molybdopterin synthase sulfur carrier subunit [Galdieria sulphuraria]|nr:Molybdopterin synthase sulfur carrier subunit [Galdieria sulphuraria]